MLRVGWHLELVLMWNLEEDWTLKEKKYLGSSTIFGGVRVRILEWISYTKCTICIISLVLKWAEL